MGRYSDALDGLNDTYNWCLSQRGYAVIAARGMYLSDNTFNAMDVETANVTISDTLKDAEPAFWDAKLGDIIQKSAPLLPLTWRLTDPLLFTHSGYIWFERPVEIPGNHGLSGCNLGETITAISWTKRPRSVFMDIVFYVRPSKQNIENIFLPTSADIEDRKGQWPYADRAIVERVKKAETNPRERERLINDMAISLALYRPGGIPWVITPWRLGETIQKTFESSVSDGFIDRDVCAECNLIYARVFAASLNFLGTKVFISTPRAPDRTTARRVPAKPKWSNINVITLRHAERVMHEGEQNKREVEWSCHFLVGSKDGGFWRRQPIKNANGEWIHEWRWIAQFMKGDPKKPFKPLGKRTYVVNR